MITEVLADGTDVRAYDDGQGPVILVIHPGLDDGRSWEKVARRLAGRFRVVRIVRRHYRVDIPAPSSYSMAKEVEDVLALAKSLGEPIMVVGHSSGAVVALEALVAAPTAFAGAVLFEPPVPTGPAPGSDALERAKAAIAAGKPGKAMQIFVRDIVGLPASQAWLLRPLTAVTPKLRSLAPRQITDLEGLGQRLPIYARIQTPTVLLGGERSPAHLRESLDALAAVIPGSEMVILARRDHSAHLKAPGEVARVIETMADRVMPYPRGPSQPGRPDAA